MPCRDWTMDLSEHSQAPELAWEQELLRGGDWAVVRHDGSVVVLRQWAQASPNVGERIPTGFDCEDEVVFICSDD